MSVWGLIRRSVRASRAAKRTPAGRHFGPAGRLSSPGGHGLHSPGGKAGGAACRSTVEVAKADTRALSDATSTKRETRAPPEGPDPVRLDPDERRRKPAPSGPARPRRRHRDSIGRTPAPSVQAMSTVDARPDPDLVEAIARRVVELLGDGAGLAREPRYVDAATLARELNVERDWVYANARHLGAIRLGDGPRGRLRFDRELVAERLAEAEAGPGSKPRRVSRRAKRRTRESLRPKRVPPGGGVKSTQRQRRAGVLPPARSPKRHQTGGSPE